MSRILFAWELGGNYGHLFSLLPLARELDRRGHEVSLVLKDLSHAQQIGNHNFRLLQAPIWLPRVAGMPSPISYPDILLRRGYHDGDALMGLVMAWRGLFELMSPQLLILDHAPTALLASTGLPTARMMYGNGFVSPPRLHPIPTFVRWQRIPQQRLITCEQRVLATVNDVITALGHEALPTLADLFRVDADVLYTFRELDSYPEREDGHYCGPVLPTVSTGVDPDWPPGNGARIFAYVYPNYPAFDALMQALKTSSHRVIVHAPGASRRQADTCRAKNVRFSREPLNMGKVCEQCDLVVCHSAVGTGTLALLAGRPVLLLPVHAEQLTVALNVEALGAAVVVGTPVKYARYKKLLEEVLTDKRFAQGAASFAERHADFDPSRQIAALANRCEALIQGNEATCVEL